jgi:WD40-like Beta Propeller Repeat
MSKVDDELTRRLHQAERPVNGDDLFKGLERRRTHRERLRRVQAGLVAFAVLAATAGGFTILRDAFDARERNAGQTPPHPANGEIVFVKDGDDVRQHIYAAQPDGSGERQITEGSANDSNPAVSPDGRTVAFARHLVEKNLEVIATVPIEGGPITWQTSEYVGVSDPTWSPDGTQIAFIDSVSGELNIAEVNGNQVRQIDLPAAAGWDPDSLGDIRASHPSWSPDGSWIAIEARVETDVPTSSSDLALVRPDGTGLQLLVTQEREEYAPAWSPDGSRIAFLRLPRNIESLESLEEIGGPNEIWTVAPDGGGETLIASTGEGSLRLDIAWAPDATSLLVSDGTWISRVDPSPTGDPETNFVRLVQGFSPSWQPLLIDAEPSVTANPEPSPEPDGQDIGLGVRMCDLEVLDGIDWDGTGVDGAAWTGAPVDEDGGCSSAADVQHVVAVDRDGDGIAEQGSTSTLRTCLLCHPFDTVDLNDDGVLELVVLEEASSTPTYSVFEVNRPGSERSPGVYPIIVIAPGAPAMNLDASKAVRFTVGGDEGFSGSIGCDDAGPGSPILRYTWVRGAVDADTELRVDITRLWFGEDGVFHIESVDHFSVPRDPEPTELRSTKPACGVDFHPDA